MTNRSRNHDDDFSMAHQSGPNIFVKKKTADFVVGLFVPRNGIAGIWGPSTLACAELAVEELNEAGGIGGRRITICSVGSDDEAESMHQSTLDALSYDRIDAIVGMHTSSVRQIVKRAAGGLIPYVYTPLYEGGENTQGVYAIGETPDQQLRPALQFLRETYRADKWLFIGHDYLWPRRSNSLARRYLREYGAEVLGETYLPLAADTAKQDFDAIFELIARLKPNALMISLIGQDAIDFNREFGRRKLSRHMVRLSCATEENMLLAIGADNTDGLFVSSSYFAALRSENNMSFKERYYTRFSERAPTLNALGQSIYEGMYFLSALAQRAEETTGSMLSNLSAPLPFHSIRGTQYHHSGRADNPMYLAQAQGHFFEVTHRF